MSQYNYYNGGFRGLEAGMRYLSNRDSNDTRRDINDSRLQHEQYQFDEALGHKKERAASDDAYRDRLANDRLEMFNKNYEEQVNARIGRQDIQRLDTEGINGLREGQRNKLDAQAGDIRQDTQGKKDERSDLVDARVASNISNEIEVLGGLDKALQNPQFTAKVVAIASANPELRKGIEQNHNIETDTDSLKEVGGSGSYAFTGKSGVNGQKTVATAKNGVIADGATDGAISTDPGELVAFLLARGVMGGDRSPATLQLATGFAKTSGIPLETMGDGDAAIRMLKENTQPAPDDNAVQARDGGYNGGFQIPTGPNPAPDAAIAEERADTLAGLRGTPQDPVARDRFQKAMAANAMYPGGGGADQVAAASQGFGIGPDAVSQNRYNESLANRTDARMAVNEHESALRIREGDAASGNAINEAGAASELAKAEATFTQKLLRPNGDVIDKSERKGLLDSAHEELMLEGLGDSLANVDFQKEVGYFDQPLENWLDAGSYTQNKGKALFDMTNTLRDPGNQAKLADAIGVPFESWKRTDYQKAGEIIKLARKGDEKDHFLGIDMLGASVNTFGEVSDDAIRQYLAGQRVNTRSK